MTRRTLHGLCTLVGVVCVLLMPRIGTSSVERPPDVDLGGWQIAGDEVVAPVRGGGQATLTLDPELQSTTHKLLTRAHPVEGAVVVIDVRHGRLLAAVEYSTHSRPHGEILSTAKSPAASVFKIVTTAALLGRFVPPDKMVCYDGGNRRIEASHLVAARGPDAFCSPFRNALGYSRNAVFAQLASRLLDGDRLMGAAERLGFNHEVPFDFPAQVGTLDVPSEPLAFARTAAGFRDSTLSPLGAAHLANVIALRGRAAKLHIVQSAPGYSAPKGREDLPRVLNGAIAIEIRKMMEVTIHSGTSLDAFSNPEGRSYLGSIRVAGKTGTLRAGPHTPTTTWFTGFAPSRKPEIVVTVMLNNGEIWRRRANEVARDVLRAYFVQQGRRLVTHPFSD